MPIQSERIMNKYSVYITEKSDSYLNQVGLAV